MKASTKKYKTGQEKRRMKKHTKRTLAILLALIMLIGLLPAAALAVDDAPEKSEEKAEAIEKIDVAEKEKAAQSALDMALQRGGDQVVVKNPDGTQSIYGGKTKTIQTIFSSPFPSARCLTTQLPRSR